MRSTWIRYLYLGIGSLSLALGLIGIFLPLLPTTPFLLLSAWCFERGSDRFHAWLLNHRWFGPVIRDWRDRNAIHPRYKILATVMILGSGTYLLSNPTIPVAGKISYSLFSACVLAYIWTRNSR